MSTKIEEKHFWKLIIRHQARGKSNFQYRKSEIRLAWTKKYRSWTVNDSKKVIFSHETRLFLQGCKIGVVRRSEDETLLPDDI
ncbi:hypothetical protein TNCV_3179771 [Trichonephila clavipes]|nr:hypothetical protein TNCV_3179771 [Trichonephila clavipes]